MKPLMPMLISGLVMQLMRVVSRGGGGGGEVTSEISLRRLRIHKFLSVLVIGYWRECRHARIWRLSCLLSGV